MPKLLRVAAMLCVALEVVACGNGGGTTHHQDVVDAGGNSPTSSSVACGEVPAGFVCIRARVAADSAKDLENVEISVLGQPQAKTRTNDKGEFALNLDTGLSAVTSDGTKSVRTNSKTASDYTVVAHQRESHLGRAVQVHVMPGDGTMQVEDIRLLPTGAVTGSATLAGQHDHTGIQVYIPGTSYLATTDKDGKFAVSDVPPGIYPFVRAERDGYHAALVSEVEVASAQNVELAPLSLSVDTGAQGGFEFVNVVNDALGYYTTSAKVTLAIEATEDALVMMLSERADFEGANWQPLQTPTVFDFGSDGQHTLFLKLANANGLETAPVHRTITVDTNPRVTITSPGTTAPSPRVRVDWSDTRVANARYALQLATDAEFQDLREDIELPLALQKSEYNLSGTLEADKPYYVRVAIVDGTQRFNWSDTLSFSVDFNDVTLLGPEGTQPRARPEYRWQSASIDQAKYHVQVSKSASFDTLVEDTEPLWGAGDTSSYIGNVTLEQGATYYWRVSVVWEGSKPSVESAFTEPKAFSVDLGTVSIDIPNMKDGKEPDSTPNIEWSTGWAGAAYRVQIAADAAFSSLVEEGNNLSFTHYEMQTVLQQDGTYYVRVAVLDPRGGQGTWAGPVSFQVDVGTVELLDPEDAVLTNVAQPVFKWNYGVGQKFRLEYGTDAGLAGATVVDDIAIAPEYKLAATLPDTDDTTYYWAVTPIDENGVTGRRSAIRSFTLDTLAPSASIVIDDGADTTYLEQVTVKVKASDAHAIADMYVGQTDPGTDIQFGYFTDSVELDYTSLASTATGTITAYGYVRDQAGNVTELLTDSIALQRTLIAAATLSADTSWTAANSPYVVTGNVVVANPATLTIDPGVTVAFRANTQLEIQSGGTAGESGIAAIGTSVDPIVLIGAKILLNYGKDWKASGVPLLYGAAEEYVLGPHFEHVNMSDGTIFVKDANNGAPAPALYARNSKLGSIAPLGSTIASLYLEHDSVGNVGDTVGEVEFPNAKILNSYIATMRADGYFANMKVTHCDIKTLFIDRWQPDTALLEYNNLYDFTWLRPSTTNTAVIHNNNFLGTGTHVLTLTRDFFGNGADVNATGNYWGSAATAEMDQHVQNISAIYDSWDDVELVTVDYSGYLSSPIPSAGPDW